jgi:hypothetical protein
MSKELRSRRQLTDGGAENYYLANQHSDIQEVSSYQEDEEVTHSKNLVSPGFSKYVEQANDEEDQDIYNNQSVSENSNELSAVVNRKPS